jgi:hypothetical protein
MSESTGEKEPTPDFREWVKQFTQPLVDSVDSRVRKQIDDRVDQHIEATLATRLSVLERAVADLDRALKELQERSA